jgi:hypothetical protein
MPYNLDIRETEKGLKTFIYLIAHSKVVKFTKAVQSRLCIVAECRLAAGELMRIEPYIFIDR